MKITKEDLLTKAEQILENEGEVTKAEFQTPEEVLANLILPGLENSKDTLSTIYFKSKQRGGVLGKLKTKLQTKIINTVINVIEKQSMKQQKFNNLTYKAIDNLILENAKLREEIQNVSKNTNNT